MRRLIWFSAGFFLACLLSCALASPVFPVLSAGLLCLSAILWKRKVIYQISRRAFALTLGATLAFLWFSGYTALFRAPAEKLADTTQTLSARVLTYPEQTSIGGYCVTLELDSGVKILVYGSEDWQELVPGDRMTAQLRLRSSARLYDEENNYYPSRGIYLMGYTDDPPQMVETGGFSLRTLPQLCTHRLKAGLEIALDAQVVPLAKAVTVGDKSALSGVLRSDLNRSGIMHAAVVSGLHISFLMAVVLFLSRGRRPVALAMLPLLLFYALMAGGSPAALRSVLMQAILLVGHISQRQYDPLISLSAALLILLIRNPYAAMSASLQLSFAAVLGILLVSYPVFSALIRVIPGRHRERHSLLMGIFRFFAATLSVSLGAILFTTPLIVFYFRRFSLVGPLTNLLVIPVLSLFMVGSLILGTLALFFPAVMAVAGFPVSLLGRYILAVASLTGRLPLATLGSDLPGFFLWLGLLYLCVCTIRRSPHPWRQVRISVIGLTLLLLCALGVNVLSVRRSDLTVTALQVGQGASTLIRWEGHSLLIDCGGNESVSAGDIAADTLAAGGSARLDALVFTHLDDDHFNGTELLLRRVRVDAIYYPDTPSDNLPGLLALAGQYHIPVYPVSVTVTVTLGETSLTLYPPILKGSDNEAGLFVLCSRDGFDVLITGDAGSFAEKTALRHYPIPDIELLLVGHHGSAGSTCSQFLNATRPELAIISVGNNSYGHPTGETLERLARSGAAIYRTDTHGPVTVRVRGNTISVK